MALGGRDRTFKATRTGNVISADSQVGVAKGSIAKETYRSIRNSWFCAPDIYWTWAMTATAAGIRILRDRGIGLVFTSSSPFSSLVVGGKLQKAGAKWVADFRDPLAYTQRLSSDLPRIYQKQRNIVRSALANADAVTVLSSSFSSIYFDMFGKQGVDPVFIPTGIDESLVESLPPEVSERRPYLLFAGEYLADYDTAFLEAFATAVVHPDLRRTGFKLLMVGTLELNRKRLLPLMDKFNLHEHVEFLDQQPQREVYKLLKRAHAGVLVPGARACWWTNFAKMTDCIGMHKPVVAVVPDPSEARSALTRSRLGIFLDGSPHDRATTLIDFLLGKYKLPAPDENECERYTAHRQAQSFVELFESLST